ncbi:MAG: TRAP transporter small permease [Desulfobacterales bacterium]
MFKLLDGLSHGLARVTGGAVVLLAAALVAALAVSIFFRYVVGRALSWPEEISLMLFAWMTLLSGSLGVRENFHVRLTLLTDRLPPRAAQALEILSTLGVALFGLMLIYSGADLLARTMEHLTPTLRLSLDWVNWSAPVCGALILVHALARLAGAIRPPRKERP